ncbi:MULTISPECIES: peptidylprolyl isomerase [Helcococcus]|uniref:peptidylprolyl isomerase n=1 Tax=Helcococcus bovis TaxID=3153252 RepID=A0ABW9F4J9_9FIRM
MKKIKLLSIILAATIFVAGCQAKTDKNGSEKADVSKTKDAKDADLNKIKITDLRGNTNIFMDINGQKVTFDNFYKYYDLYSGILAMQRNLTGELSNLLVRDKIIKDELKAKNITVTDEEVKKEIDLYVKNLGGEEEFGKYLSILGVKLDVFTENIKNSLLNKKHLETFKKENKATDEEVKKYYEANKDSLDNVDAKHILVDDEEKANEISNKLKAGEDFEKLSTKNSKDTAANAKGGQLGKVTRAAFEPDFVEAAFNLKDNEVSAPVKTKYGYHVIVVNKNNVGLDKNKEKINDILTKQKYNKNIEEKIKSTKVNFYDFNGKKMENKN